MSSGCLLETASLENRDALCLLAVGGMAELHLVRLNQPGEPERLAVVKRLQRQLVADPEYVRMFLDEARIASTLRHPNIVEIYEVGDRPEAYFIAMEHLHGHDLRRAMARVMTQHAEVLIDQALSIARAVADGLHYTHGCTDALGAPMYIVHRDVSPHNVIMTYEGAVKIVDFGIAKACTQVSRTRTGVLKGKVAYMSPEQAAGQRVDHRSDVFSIGILLWEMTTGRWLYRRRTELETLNAVVHSRPPRPSRVVARYPRDLEKIVMKALARAPAERWATAGELRDAIDELARRRRLTLGPEPVQSLMARLFADEIAAWQHARSQGRSLGEHLAGQAELAVDPDDDDMLPAPSFGSRASQMIAWFYQHRWAMIGGGVAAALAGAWFAMRLSGGEAEPAAPTVSRPATPVPASSPAARVVPAGPGLVTPGAASPGLTSPAPASPASASPASAGPALLAEPDPPVDPPAAQASPANPPPRPAAPHVAPPPARPERARPKVPPPATRESEPPAEAATVQRPPPKAPKPPPATKTKPTIEELDRLP